MKIRGLIDEDIVNYTKTSMYIAFPNLRHGFHGGGVSCPQDTSTHSIMC